MLRPNPNFRDSSLHRIFNFGIWISGKSESIYQFWDFCESFNKNLAFFNKTWHFRLPNVKIFFHFSTKPRKIFAKSCESLANPGSESWKKDSNQSQIMKRDSNPGSRIRFGLNTSFGSVSDFLRFLCHVFDENSRCDLCVIEASALETVIRSEECVPELRQQVAKDRWDRDLFQMYQLVHYSRDQFEKSSMIS